MLGHRKSTTQSLGGKVYQHHLKELDLDVVSDALVSILSQWRAYSVEDSVRRICAMRKWCDWVMRYADFGGLRAQHVVGARVDNRTRGGNCTRGGNRTRAIEVILAMRFLVASHAVVICVAVFVVRGISTQVDCWFTNRMLQTWLWVAREVADVEVILATFTCTSLD